MTKSRLENALYIVSTPLGNLGDITLRALEVLKNSDIILCEDSRVTLKLLQHFGINKKTIPYHDFSEEKLRDKILHMLQNEGKIISLVSDGGTPLISDPGYKLVRLLRENNIPVRSVPGPSSVIAALTISGIPTDRFMFAGFLPNKQSARITTLKELKDIRSTLIFFESPRRLIESLQDFATTYPDRKIVIAREITKIYEETREGLAIELINLYKEIGEPRGEIVIIVHPPSKIKDITDEEIEEKLSNLLDEMTTKDASSFLAEELSINKTKIYNLAKKIKDRKK